CIAHGEAQGAILVEGQLVLPAERRLRLFRRQHFVVPQAPLIGVRTLEPVEGRQREIEKDRIDRDHHAEEAEQDEKDMPPGHLLCETYGAHWSGPWNVVVRCVSVPSARSLTTKVISEAPFAAGASAGTVTKTFKVAGAF